MQTPEDGGQAQGAADERPVLRIAALADPGGAAALAGLLEDAAGVVVETVASAGELRALIHSDRPDLALLAVDQTVAWPVTLAEEVAAALRDRVPLLVLCEVAHDAELIERRVAGPGVTVLMRAKLTAGRLVDAARTAVARHRAGNDLLTR
jgi:hypothetical protein